MLSQLLLRLHGQSPHRPIVEIRWHAKRLEFAASFDFARLPLDVPRVLGLNLHLRSDLRRQSNVRGHASIGGLRASQDLYSSRLFLKASVYKRMAEPLRLTLNSIALPAERVPAHIID